MEQHMSNLQAVTDDNFETEVLKSDKPVLVDFWAEWCGPCRQVGPILDELNSEHGEKLTFVKLNVDENPVTPSNYRVTGIPTINVYQGGEVVKTIVGARPKAALLKELEDLQERVSRLTLEKGNFRTEIDKYMQLLEEERSTKAEDLRKVTGIEKELETLVDSKKQLLAESDTLRKALQDVQTKMKSSEQEITDRFTTQLKSTADLLAKETQKTTALNTMISQLKGGESTARLDADKSKKENKVLNEKYAHQAAEHAQAFTVSNVAIASLTNHTNVFVETQRANQAN